MNYALLLLPALFLLQPSPLQAETAKEYQKEIDTERQNLEQLQKALQDKKSEKEKYQQEERSIRRELQRIERQLTGIQRRKEEIRRQMRKAQRNLAQAGKELKLAGWEKNQWHGVLKREADLWFRDHYSYYRLYASPVLEQLRLQALRQKKTHLASAQEKETKSLRAMDKWKAAQTDLTVLKARQERTAAEWEHTRSRKAKLLKTTSGRRISAEEEIKKLSESARELERVITELQKRKKKTEQEAQAGRRFEAKKDTLPWPVTGKVITQFGRSRHPELDTYVISNGIKISCTPGSDVRAVSAGEAIYCGEFRAYGLMLILDHGGGFYTIYGMLGELNVEEGQKMKTGDPVGKVATRGEPLLYFEVRSEDKPEDPLLWLK